MLVAVFWVAAFVLMAWAVASTAHAWNGNKATSAAVKAGLKASWGFAGLFAVVFYLKYLHPLLHGSPDLGYGWQVFLLFLMGLLGLAVSVVIGFVLGWIGATVCGKR